MPRRFWLLKSDPCTFGWRDLAKAKGGKTVWDGVLFDHSQSDKAVVGTCHVTRAGFPDREDGNWTAIEIALDEPLARQALTLGPDRSGVGLLVFGLGADAHLVGELPAVLVRLLRVGRGSGNSPRPVVNTRTHG